MVDDSEPMEEGVEPVEDTEVEGGEAPSEEPEGDGSVPRIVLKRTGAETDIAFPILPPAVVGRFDPALGPIDVDLGSIDESVYISRKHARIECNDGVWSVHDLGSSNGTFVLRDDFERVDEATLEDGTEIAFGNARFVFRID